jgi:hypothetical protein
MELLLMEPIITADAALQIHVTLTLAKMMVSARQIHGMVK